MFYIKEKYSEHQEILSEQKYVLYLIRNSLLWSGSQYLEARAELYSLLIKSVLGEHISQVYILTDRATFSKFYIEWLDELKIHIPDIVRDRFKIYVTEIDGFADKHTVLLFDQEVVIQDELDTKRMDNDTKELYLNSWIDNAASVIDEMISERTDVCEVGFAPPDYVYQYQRCQEDAVLEVIAMSESDSV